MRKLSFFAAASIFAAPLVASALPLSDSLFDKGTEGKVMRSGDATHIVFPDFSMKVNISHQQSYTYSDLDGLDGTRGVQDSSSFDITLLRLKLSGDALDKEWSYYFSNDFVSGEQDDGSDGSELKDFWVRWNADPEARLQAGQFKIPFSRQELNDDEKLVVLERGLANDIFAPSRNRGMMLSGMMDESAGMGYTLGLYNGESDGEGVNRGGVDNKVAFSASVYGNVGDYGPRDVEGDPRENTDEFAMTFGAAVVYGQGETDALEGSVDFDKTDVNVDAGLRCGGGLSLQSEFYYRNLSLDVDSDDDSGNDFGFYLQGAYELVPGEWELALQFDWVSPDDSFVGGQDPNLFPTSVDEGLIDTVQQYQANVNYYINGHALKVQTGVAWQVFNFDEDLSSGDDNITDAFYQVKLAGYL